MGTGAFKSKTELAVNDENGKEKKKASKLTIS